MSTDLAPAATPRSGVLDLLEVAVAARASSRRQGNELRPPGKKAQRTRAALLRSAYECFGELGYGATSVETIQQATGVSIGTFYQYFRDKADVMTTLVAEAIIRSADEIFPDSDLLLTDGDPRALLDGFIRNYAATARFQGIWEEASHHEPVIADFARRVGHLIEVSLAESIGQGMATGVVRARIDPAGAARALSAMVERVCRLTFVVDGRTDEQTVEETIDLIAGIWASVLLLDPSASNG